MAKKNNNDSREPTPPKRIAIFENQITQFKSLFVFFRKKGFCVWPVCDKGQESGAPFQEANYDEQEFRELMNAVHVFLNLQYSSRQIDDEQIEKVQDYRTRCRDYFFDSLDKWKPDLLIIDHLLSAPMHSLEGFDLARFLIDRRITVPILFLSRSDRSSKLVINGLKSIEGKTTFSWLAKGYQGELVLDDAYLSTVVLDEIEVLLKIKPMTLFPDRIPINRDK